MEVGVKTRARAMALVTEEIADNSVAVKRRKLSNEKLRSPSPSPSPSATFVETKTHSVLKGKRNGRCDAAASPRSGGVMVSCCSSTGSIEKLKVSDLEESVDQSETTAKVLPTEKTPPEAELEEFFVAAQKGLNERFKNKYNYDIVNDIPLEGRFKWIQVKKEK